MTRSTTIGRALLVGLVALVAAICPTTGASSARAESLPDFGPPAKFTRGCSYVVVAGVNGDALMEIDVFGRPAPNCRFTIRRLRMAPSQLPHGSWGYVGRWRCIWQPWAVACKRGRVTLWATNPGG
jgi:hypothetical protein